jgi:hypothetical protein
MNIERGRAASISLAAPSASRTRIRQTPPSSREAARAGFAELVQDHGSGR